MDTGKLIVGTLDDYIRQNIYTLACSDVADIYFDFIKAINTYGGNTENYTGFTEFLVYRILWHLNLVKITGQDIILKSKGSLGVRNPDIIIYNSLQRPMYSIQVKSNYYKITEDYNRHMEVLAAFPSIKIVTIAFEVRDSNHLKHIENYMSINNQYQCVILKDNNRLMKDIIADLGLTFI